ncbi:MULTISPECIES: glycosyltransferase [Bacillus cereus group]|uniref:glycosyltransferase n=1 Tax=Bacillus cereus group TaxID=86661 RepID=UPI0011A8B37E|nr:glycosyltransferase [Bacillus thuringiensis]MED2983982.1 glycosyltransferase [Bacillus thuringiensis]MRB58148.1 glycosyltransferase [Bacillus thuringiensis]
MNIPEISIIVPVYNVEKFLSQCIDSILGQSFHNYEIILVNDGSQDGSKTICERYASNYEFIQVINKENGGLSDARNTGLKIARGNYILFVDSDDYIAQNALTEINKVLEINPDIDVVFLEAAKVFEDGSIVPMNDGYEKESIHKKTYEEVMRHISELAKFPGSACTKLIKRKLIIENDLYFEKGLLSEDIDWVVQLLCVAEKYDYCEAMYYFYRQNRKGSITNTVNINNVQSLLYIINKWSKDIEGDQLDNNKNQRYLNAFMAYEYTIALANYGDLEKDDKKVLKKDLNAHSWLLSWSNNPKVRMVKVLVQLFGVMFTAKLLKIYLKYR